MATTRVPSPDSGFLSCTRRAQSHAHASSPTLRRTCSPLDISRYAPLLQCYAQDPTHYEPNLRPPNALTTPAPPTALQHCRIRFGLANRYQTTLSCTYSSIRISGISTFNTSTSHIHPSVRS
ncbi:hypothetical protein PsYK624_168610 [Phanerochaete sordida]|uniref:Uncharacterized protein n=1 Tax=Phanerochaete sordida TaxID=48140 RepID=A0A9P3GS93_9APHY|nr:hypothetical protein PsYK624_168610 [Phanerochaete sordida]